MKRIEIYGSEGSIVMEEESLKVWDMRNPTEEDERIIRKYIGRESQQNGGASDPSSLGCEGHRNEIADFADEVTSMTDSFISIKMQQLSTLEEYKKTLIYEYVTGKKEVAYA